MTSTQVDSLETALAEPPYVEDAGFTDRVMARVPASRRSLRAPILVASILASFGLGGALALSHADELVSALGTLSLHGSSGVAVVAALAGLAGAAILAAAEEVAS